MSDGYRQQNSADVPDDEWDAFLQKCPKSHHEQSSRYAANRVEHGFQCDRAVVRDNGVIIGGVQVLVQPTPVGKFARIFRGPIAINEDPVLMRQVVQQLEQVAEARGYASVRVDLFPDQEVACEALKAAGFFPTLAWYREKESFVIPLSLADEELLDRMDKKVSYYVRRADRDGITVRAGENAELGDFYRMHQKTASYQGFPLFPYDYFNYLWNLFGKLGRAQYFVAYHQGNSLAAIFNVVVGSSMYYGWGGMRRDPEAKKMQVNYLLHMTAVAWARKHGLACYDLSGTQTFKKQFALETVRWPWPLRKFYGPARTLRHKMLELTGSRPRLRRLVNGVAKLGGVCQKNEIPW